LVSGIEVHFPRSVLCTCFVSCRQLSTTEFAA
jgi:hypothetical protein